MKKPVIFILGLTGFMVASCQHETIYIPDNRDNGIITLQYNVADHTAGSTTRAVTVNPENGEENVHSLYLLFFAPSADRTGLFMGAVAPEGPFVMNQDIRVDMNESGLSPINAYKMLAVANLEGYINCAVHEWLHSLENQTERYACEQIFAYTFENRKIESDKLLMTGETEKGDGGVTNMQLTLTRSVARFDVINNARTEYDLVSVSIWNAFPETSLFGGGVVDYEKNRIQRFYGVVNDNDVAWGNGIDCNGDPNGDYYGDISGGLYCFPNQVIKPDDKDSKTTCLVIGLKKRGSSTSATYHRININADYSVQQLKRNNVYRLSILSVEGDGAYDESAAYSGGINNIQHRINYWNMDDEGLIQQQGNIILGIPSKYIRLGSEAEDRTFEIFTFGGSIEEQLEIETTWDGDAGSYISVARDGNSITVSSQALNTQGERTGRIKITYVGLEATIAIIQTNVRNQFLQVSASGPFGTPVFPCTAGAASDGSIAIEASGPWTATIYNLSENNFSFSPSGTYSGKYNSSSANENLKIHTFTQNTTFIPRNAFVLISLDADPDNHNSAIVLTQRASEKIELSPAPDQIEWDAPGKLIIQGGTSNTDFTFKVITSKNIHNTFEEWIAALDDDTYFEIVSQQSDPNDENRNTVVIRAKGENTGEIRTAVLRLSLKDFPDTFEEVGLKQGTYTLKTVPDAFNPLSTKGGATDNIQVVSNSAALTWSASINSIRSDSGILDNHTATIVGNTGEELTQNDKYPLSKSFSVMFPKLMYGNHLKGDITATVTVRLWSGTTEVRSHTFAVKQKELTPKNLVIANMHNSYGRITNNNNFGSAFRLMLNTFFKTVENNGKQIPVYPATTPNVEYIYMPNAVNLPTEVSTTITNSISYIHANQFNELTDQYSEMEDWRAADNGVLVINYDPTSTTGFINPASTLYKLGWTRNDHADSDNCKLTRLDNTNTCKIADFILNKGPFGAISTQNMIGENGDTTSSAVDITNQNTDGKFGRGVAILGEDNRAGIVIDPVNRVVYFGESQYFSNASSPVTDVSVADYPTELSDRTKLLANIYAYIVLTAQYGSNFSDLFID